jgi:hypothetical protein
MNYYKFFFIFNLYLYNIIFSYSISNLSDLIYCKKKKKNQKYFISRFIKMNFKIKNKI